MPCVVPWFRKIERFSDVVRVGVVECTLHGCDDVRFTEKERQGWKLWTNAFSLGLFDSRSLVYMKEVGFVEDSPRYTSRTDTAYK